VDFKTDSGDAQGLKILFSVVIYVEKRLLRNCADRGKMS
jgi:hypothetical protein